MFYAIYMATRPRAHAYIFHKTLGLMLYLLHISPKILGPELNLEYMSAITDIFGNIHVTEVAFVEAVCVGPGLNRGGLC